MFQKMDELCIAGDVTADTRDRFAQGAHFDINETFRRIDPEMFLDARAFFPEDSERMSFVDHEKGFVFPAKPDHFREVDDVAIHAEDGVRYHEFGSSLGECAAEGLFKSGHIIMFKSNKLGP